jgi:hypothetical protein
MNVSHREKIMLGITVLILLYGVLGLTMRKRIDNLRQLHNTRREMQAVLDNRLDLLARSQDWDDQYSELADMLPVFEQQRQVTTYWLSIMDRLATQNNLAIIRRQVSEEKRVGDAYEMQIDCKDWEGTLEGLVRFLYDLQAEGAMLDVRNMFIRPAPNKPSLLRGSFVLYCAYLREENATVANGGNQL